MNVTILGKEINLTKKREIPLFPLFSLFPTHCCRFSAHLRHKGGRICQKNCTHDSVSNERKEQRVAPQCGVHMPESNYLIFVINWEQSQICLWCVCKVWLFERSTFVQTVQDLQQSFHVEIIELINISKYPTDGFKVWDIVLHALRWDEQK